MQRILLSAAAALLFPIAAHAQQTDEQLWLSLSGSAPVGSDTRVTVEAIGRFSDRAGGFFHDEFGGMVTFKLNSRVEAGIGYRHVEDYNNGRTLPNEERLRQQVSVSLGSGFSTRLRFEQRFNSAGPQVGLRLRPQLRYTLPLAAGTKAPALIASHESFLNLNQTRWGQRDGYERMRNLVGVAVPLSDQLRLEGGYMNQYRFGRSGARDQMDHIATFSLSLSL